MLIITSSYYFEMSLPFRNVGKPRKHINLKVSSPNEVRFCFVWKISVLPNVNPLVSSKFPILNELFYLQLSYGQNYSQTYDLVLHRVDHSGSPIKTFNVSVLFESANGKCMSDVKSMTSVMNYPHNLLNFAANPVSSLCASCGYLNSYITHPGSGFNIICIFHGDFSSMFLSNETHNPCNDMYFPPNLKSLSLDLANLLKNETLADVKLKCGDHTIPAHRSVLAARSEVFTAMFQNQMAESNSGEVNIKDVEASVIELFLKYLYAGEISNASIEVLPGLYAAADKYAVLALKESCREMMISKLSKENYINFLILSDAHNDIDFKEAVINFICKYEEILEEEAWMSFIEEPSKLSIEVYKKYVKQKKK